MRSPALDAHEEDFYEEAGVMDEAAAESAEGLMTPEEPSHRVLRPRVVRNIGDEPMRAEGGVPDAHQRQEGGRVFWRQGSREHDQGARRYS